MKPKLLDLFCGAGGVGMGYYRAGFDVEGVDIKPQPHYPFKFYQADALIFPLDGYDAYHASPPCQAYSQAVKIKDRIKHPDLIAAIRNRLENKIYVIENVPRSPLKNYITLCGSSFGLPIRRHRLFESNIYIPMYRCSHKEYPRKYSCAQKDVSLQEYKDAFGIDWEITAKELSEAIPPAYTEYIGKYLMDYIMELRK
jgi:DNA (cytosine-5)-methyltransferase 1